MNQREVKRSINSDGGVRRVWVESVGIEPTTSPRAGGRNTGMAGGHINTAIDMDVLTPTRLLA